MQGTNVIEIPVQATGIYRGYAENYMATIKDPNSSPEDVLTARLLIGNAVVRAGMEASNRGMAMMQHASHRPDFTVRVVGRPAPAGAD